MTEGAGAPAGGVEIREGVGGEVEGGDKGVKGGDKGAKGGDRAGAGGEGITVDGEGAGVGGVFLRGKCGGGGSKITGGGLVGEGDGEGD